MGIATQPIGTNTNIMTKKKLVYDLKRKFSSLQKAPKSVIGVLGDGFGRVNVPDKPNYVFFRATGYPLIEVYNDRVASKDGLTVICGYDPIQPDLFQVLSAKTIQPRANITDKSIYSVPNHARTHEWMAINAGNDVIFSHLRQFMPLRPTIFGGMYVNYYRNVSWIDGEWKYISGTTMDYTDAVPISGARYLLSYVGTDGGIYNITGAIVGNISLLDLDDIPDPIQGTIPIAAIRTYAWQTGIVETRTNTDLIDLRWNSFDTSFSPAAFLTGVSHNALPDLQGGQANEYYHLTEEDYNTVISGIVSEHNDLGGLQGGESGQYYHLNEEKYNDTISGTFLHNSLEGLQGGLADDYYHLTLAQLNEKIISGTSSGGGHVIEDDGTPLAQRANLDFVGPMFVVYDDAGNDTTIVSGVSSGGTSTPYLIRSTNGSDVTIPSGYSMVIAGDYEISDGDTLELADNAIMEIT